jgi:glycerophosphoryl diester phosphodiesterase
VARSGSVTALRERLGLSLLSRSSAPQIAAADGRPWVVAHRGASAQVAEHTLSAYLTAIDAGADALECDVRLTRDGHLVCVHDRTVDRTSDGQGVVSTLELTDLAGLDFASWRRPDDPRARGAVAVDAASQSTRSEPDRISADDHGVLTLRTLLEVVTSAPRPVRLLIETKHPTRYAGLVEHELVEVLRGFGLLAKQPGPPPVTLMSFAPLALRRLAFLAPNLPRVLLQNHWLPGRRSGALPSTTTISGPGIHLIRSDPEYIARAHERGNRVFVWTVDDPSDVRLCLTLGADAIITNRPAQTIEQVDKIFGPRSAR